MAKSRSFGSFFLAMVVILSLVCKEVVSQQDGRCCKDHPELGHCAPGKDDDPNGGKCWTYCITECSKGGLCKKLSSGRHVCHCYC